LGKVMARLGAQQDKYLLERVFGLGRGDSSGMLQFAKGLGHIGDNLGGHLCWRQFIINQPCANGAPRHAVIFGRCRALGYDHAAFTLYCSYAQCAVRTCAGKDYADGAFTLILG